MHDQEKPPQEAPPHAATPQADSQLDSPAPTPTIRPTLRNVVSHIREDLKQQEERAPGLYDRLHNARERVATRTKSIRDKAVEIATKVLNPIDETIQAIGMIRNDPEKRKMYTDEIKAFVKHIPKAAVEYAQRRVATAIENTQKRIERAGSVATIHFTKLIETHLNQPFTYNGVETTTLNELISYIDAGVEGVDATIKNAGILKISAIKFARKSAHRIQSRLQTSIDITRAVTDYVSSALSSGEKILSHGGEFMGRRLQNTGDVLNFFAKILTYSGSALESVAQARVDACRDSATNKRADARDLIQRALRRRKMVALFRELAKSQRGNATETPPEQTVPGTTSAEPNFDTRTGSDETLRPSSRDEIEELIRLQEAYRDSGGNLSQPATAPDRSLDPQTNPIL